MRRVVIGFAAMVLLGNVCSGAGKTKESSADAGICKWKDGKQGVFMLEFDDSCRSQVKNAIPELKKRNMVGTFYINAGNGHFKSNQKAWEKEIPKTGMEYGNHTFTHKGAPSLEFVDQDIAKAQEAINKCFPDRKVPRLISFARPGGVPWKIKKEEEKELLAKYNLVKRPPFFGYPIHVKTKEAVLAMVDKAIAKGEMKHLDFHGVGGDWLSTPMDVFVPLLDKLDANRDKVWITDPVSYHKYMTERNGATLKVKGHDSKKMTLALTCKTDSALYDLDLTLHAKVPASWKSCTIKQGKEKTQVDVKDGQIQFSAAPQTGDIVIARSK